MVWLSVWVIFLFTRDWILTPVISFGIGYAIRELMIEAIAELRDE